MVVQDVDAAPAPHRLFHRCGERCLARDIGLERSALEAFARDECGGFRRSGEVAIDGEDAGALAREAQHRRAAVADSFAGAPPGANDNRDLALQAHQTLPSLLSFSRQSMTPVARVRGLDSPRVG